MNRNGKIVGSKHWEFQMDGFSNWNSYFSFNISWTTRKDHAGFEIEFNICGWLLMFNIYDCRHWNDLTNEWCKYEEKEQ
jgi:hypothetical protein